MSVAYMLSRSEGVQVIGCILHGAYGDYYEQLVSLRHLKRIRPDIKIVCFYATEERRQALSVYDLSFIEAAHLVCDIEVVHVERFVQFQIRDSELYRDVFSGMSDELKRKFDWNRLLKPWAVIRELYRRRPETCDIPLNQSGIDQLERSLEESRLTSAFESEYTVGFLWRYRRAGQAISGRWQVPEHVVRHTKSELLGRLIRDWKAHVVIAGMNVQQTTENEERLGGKFPEYGLSLPCERTTYLKGGSWAIEVEIMRRCSLCLVMPSGFAEALLFKRTGPTVLVDPPLLYVALLLKNQMPLFDITRPGTLTYLLRQPHSANRVLNYLRKRDTLPR